MDETNCARIAAGQAGPRTSRPPARACFAGAAGPGGLRAAGAGAARRGAAGTARHATVELADCVQPCRRAWLLPVNPLRPEPASFEGSLVDPDPGRLRTVRDHVVLCDHRSGARGRA